MIISDLKNIYYITGTLMWKIEKNNLEVNPYTVTIGFCFHGSKVSTNLTVKLNFSREFIIFMSIKLSWNVKSLI